LESFETSYLPLFNYTLGDKIIVIATTYSQEKGDVAMAVTSRRNFQTFFQERQLEPAINELAWKLVEAHEAGIDIEPYFEVLEEGLGQWAGRQIGQGVDWLATKGAKAGVRAGRAAISGLGGGIMAGARNAGRALMHGQGANNPSFQLKDALAKVQAATQAAPNFGDQGKQVAQILQQMAGQLDQQMKVMQGAERAAGAAGEAEAAASPMQDQPAQQSESPPKAIPSGNRGATDGYRRNPTVQAATAA
jgi:hypothetical protein